MPTEATLVVELLSRTGWRGAAGFRRSHWLHCVTNCRLRWTKALCKVSEDGTSVFCLTPFFQAKSSTEIGVVFFSFIALGLHYLSMLVGNHHRHMASMLADTLPAITLQQSPTSLGLYNFTKHLKRHICMSYTVHTSITSAASHAATSGYFKYHKEMRGWSGSPESLHVWFRWQ